MPIFPWKAKQEALYWDQVRGFPGTHPDLRGMLEWLVELCQREKWSPPTITCFGRTRDDQEAIYLPTYLQVLPDQVEQARAKARGRFSWHCIPTAPEGVHGFCRAMDLRYWVWRDDTRKEIFEQARQKWPHAELLDHAVPGGSRHVHFGFPDPAGKPQDWL